MQELKTVTGKELFEMELQEPRVIVENILPAGLHILAGSPKIGKSWLAIWLCNRIATGQDVWGFKTAQGRTLYLCLEDNLPRIKSRLMSITEEGSANTAFATEALSLGAGLNEQIECFIQKHPDTLLIVIDTLQKIRQQVDTLSYGNDYADIGRLKKIADTYDIAIVCINHLRKMKDDDPFNMISGTTGLSGSADGMFVLKRENRSSGDAVLYATGRDIADLELPLEFDHVNCIWRLSEGYVTEKKFDEPIIQAIADYISTNTSFKGTISDLLDNLNIKHISAAIVSKKIRDNVETLNKEFGIEVEFVRDRQSRTVTLTKIVCDGDDSGDGNDGIYTPLFAVT